MLRFKKIRSKLILSFFNTIFLTWFTFFWLSQPYTFDDELVLIQLSSVFKNIWFNKHAEKPDPKRFLFVNVAWDKALVAKVEDASGFPIGEEAITDRKKLADFFTILNQKPNNHRFLLCDIFFKGISPDDSLLQVNLRQLKNYAVSYHLTPQNKPDYPIFNAKRALADYETTDENLCVKFKLIYNDSLETFPIHLYEQLHQKYFHQSKFWSYLGDKAIFNAFILDYRLRNYDFQNTDPSKTMYSKVYLGELLLLDTATIHEMTKDKIIILGDFDDRDFHKTIYGQMPGALILLNVFLALEAGDNEISWQFLAFLLISYMLISYKCFETNDQYDRWIQRLTNSKTARFVATFTGYAIIFCVLSMVCYAFFNIHLTILILAFYMNILEKVYTFVLKKVKKRKERFKVLKN